MNTLRELPRGAAVVALVALLAGCAGAGQVPGSGMGIPNTGAAPFNDVGSVQSDGNAPTEETLSATQVTFEKAGCGPVRVGHDIRYVVNFAARGIASGPRKGTFEANGLWTLNRPVGGVATWKFVEHFAVTSGATRVVGAIDSSGQDGNRPPHSPVPQMSCTGFGPAGFEYRSTNGRGAAQLRSIQHDGFDETLQGL